MKLSLSSFKLCRLKKSHLPIANASIFMIYHLISVDIYLLHFTHRWFWFIFSWKALYLLYLENQISWGFLYSHLNYIGWRDLIFPLQMLPFLWFIILKPLIFFFFIMLIDSFHIYNPEKPYTCYTLKIRSLEAFIIIIEAI